MAAITSAINMALMYGVQPSLPYRAMKAAQLLICTLELATGLIVAIAIWQRLNGFPIALAMQWWLQSLMGASLLASAAVSFSRILYDRGARQPQAKMTQELINDLRDRVENCDRSLLPRRSDEPA